MLLLRDNFSQEIVLLQQPPTEIPAAAFQALPQYSAVSNKPSSSIQMDKLEMLGFRVTGAIGVDHWSKHSSPYPGFSLRARASVLSSLFCRPSLVSRTKCCRVWQQISLLEVSLLLKSAVCAVQLILWTQQASACFSKPRTYTSLLLPLMCVLSPPSPMTEVWRSYQWWASSLSESLGLIGYFSLVKWGLLDPGCAP